MSRRLPVLEASDLGHGSEAVGRNISHRGFTPRLSLSASYDNTQQTFFLVSSYYTYNEAIFAFRYAMHPEATRRESTIHILYASFSFSRLNYVTVHKESMRSHLQLISVLKKQPSNYVSMRLSILDIGRTHVRRYRRMYHSRVAKTMLFRTHPQRKHRPSG